MWRDTPSGTATKPFFTHWRGRNVRTNATAVFIITGAVIGPYNTTRRAARRNSAGPWACVGSPHRRSALQVDEPEVAALGDDRMVKRDRLEVVGADRPGHLAREAVQEIALDPLRAGVVVLDQEERRPDRGEQR